ncbi:MAG: hypothetical protein M1840_008681 [Geoglossum simile]|nr:MAG: hypothetical protein M1840_008681 [Geoglossum simile]
MAANMDSNPVYQGPKTLPEVMVVLTLLDRRVREVEKQLVMASKESCDALETHKTAMDALMRYLQTHGAVTGQLFQDLTVMKARLDQSRVQLNAYLDRVAGERRLAALTRSRTQAETTAQQLREQEQRLRRLIQQTAEVPELLPLVEPRVVLEEPDWGDDLIYFSNDDLLTTEVGGEWIASSTQQTGPTSTTAGQRADSSSTTNVASGQGTPGRTGVSPLDQEIDWQDYFGSNYQDSAPPPIQRKSDSESRIAGFTPSEHARLYPQYRAPPAGLNVTDEPQGNQAGQTSDEAQASPNGQLVTLAITADSYSLTDIRFPTLNTKAGETSGSRSLASAKNGKGGEAGSCTLPAGKPPLDDSGSGGSSSATNGKGKAAERGYPTTETNVGSTSESGSGSNNAKGKDGTIGQGAIVTGIGAGEPCGGMSRSRFAHPTPGVLRTGLDLPSPKDDVIGCSNARGMHGPMIQNNHHVSHHFVYRIRFSPPLKERLQHLRTVHIRNLPAAITLKVLMSSVRGGSVLKATLLNTIPITGSPSALITFIDPCGAADYVAFANLHPIRYTGTLATVTMVNTPTFPISRYIVGALKALNCTRVLRLGGIPLARATLLQDLDLDWAARLGLIEDIRVQNEFSVVLTFASIEMALQAYNAFQALQYHNAEGTFLPDPCAEPLGHLFKQQAEQCGHFEDTAMKDAYDENESELCSTDDEDDKDGTSSYEPGSSFPGICQPLIPSPAREELISIIE